MDETKPQSTFEQYALIMTHLGNLKERFEALGEQLCEIEGKVDKITETLHAQEMRMLKIEGTAGQMQNDQNKLWRGVIVAIVLAVVAVVIAIAAAAVVVAP